MSATKRKQTSDSTDEVYSNKSRANVAAIARVDPTYGQRSAFSLDGADDQDVDLSMLEEMDAMSYLRSVRREAEGIPNLLVAPKNHDEASNHDIYNDGVGDFRGRYVDGTFYAPDVVDDEEKEDQEQLQPHYFDSIIARFQALHERLSQSPPFNVLQALGEDTPIYLGYSTVPKVKWWKWKLRTIDPLPAQIAAMDKDTILGLLRIIANSDLLRRGESVNIHVSRWIWSLLAKLPDRGSLNSEEIGIVRDIGKKAVLIAVGIREGNKYEEGMQEVEASYNDDDQVFLLDNNRLGDQSDVVAVEDVEEDISFDSIAAEDASDRINEGESSVDDADALPLAKARILRLLHPTNDHQGDGETELADTIPTETLVPEEVHTDSVCEPGSKSSMPERSAPPTHNTNATVDMILTIAGEIYGQRDLLEFRGGWEE